MLLTHPRALYYDVFMEIWHTYKSYKRSFLCMSIVQV